MLLDFVNKSRKTKLIIVIESKSLAVFLCDMQKSASKKAPTKTNTCFHCADPCGDQKINYDNKYFCCQGCKTVYQLFVQNEMETFYELQSNPGHTPKEVGGKYDYLRTESIAQKLLSFSSDTHAIVSLYIPAIHCSSCIWLLENLSKLQKGVLQSEVNFPKKTVQIQYYPKETNLYELVMLLSHIGYEPYISLDKDPQKKPPKDRSLIYKLGVAGFAFGNIMFLSFPEYFETSEFWLDQYKGLFRSLTLLFSLPVVSYAATDYLKSAYKGLRAKHLNIDLPISLGIIALFTRSVTDILMGWGPGFLDSLSGLIFFLLLGKFFQQKTYQHLSFERDYTAYFPMAATQIDSNGKEQHKPIHQIEEGDTLLIRHQEVIPVDGVVSQGHAAIDYSYVSGESTPYSKEVGDAVFAGGKQMAAAIEITATKTVSQSYLTQLWSHAAFSGKDKLPFQHFTDRISKRFTIAILSIAVAAGMVWLFLEPAQSLHVFTAVLIVACPCVLALAAPFTLGNMLRIYGRQGLYLKDIHVIEKIAGINSFVFDKTGTLSSTQKSHIEYHGAPLHGRELALLKNSFRNANHPLSRTLYNYLPEAAIQLPIEFHEILAQGIECHFAQHSVKAGAASFTGATGVRLKTATRVHIAINNKYKGFYEFKTPYRVGIRSLISRLKNKQIYVFSGDQDTEKQALIAMGFQADHLFFNQKPEDKLRQIEHLQNKARRVMMVGDGLNDAGALAKSDVGLALSEDIAVFTPACDGILEAGQLLHLDQFQASAQRAMKIIQYSLIGSLCYNLIGIGFAVSGHLEPVVAAILMPLSAISIVGYTTLATHRIGKKLRALKSQSPLQN